MNKNETAAFYIDLLNLILIASIIFGTEFLISQYSNPATEVKLYYLGIINAGLIFMSMLRNYISCKKKIFILGFYLAAVTGYFLLTSFWSDYKYVSYRSILSFITFLLLYFNFVYNIDGDRKIKFLLTVLIVTTVFVSLLGLLQFYGYDFYKWGRVYELFEDMNILRIISCQGNPNFLGVFLISVFPIFIVCSYKKFEGNFFSFSAASLILLFLAVHFNISLFYQPNGIEINVELLLGAIIFVALLIIFLIKKILYRKNLKNKLLEFSNVFNAIIFLTILFALFFTYNRGGYAGFIVELAILFYFQKFYFKQKIFTKKFIRIICLIAGIFLIIYVISDDFSHKLDLVGYRLVNSSNLNQADVKIRFYLWQVVLNVVRQNYFFGTGIGTFMNYFPSEITENWKHIFPKPEMIVESAHSELLEILLETGVAGLILVILTLFRVFYLNIKLIKTIKDDFYKYAAVGILASLAGILTHALFETKFRYASTVVPIIFYIAILEYLASTYLYDSKIKAVNKNVKSNSLYQTTVLVIAGIISILLIMFYLKPLASNIYNNFASIEIRVNKESLDPALDYLNKALFYDEYNEISLYTKMRILDFKRDFQNAEKIALKLMSISPYFKDVNQLYGDILLKQNKTIEADYFINKGLRVSKPFDSYYLLKSQNLIREQKYEQAEEILKKNYSRIENKSYINYMLGKISELGNMKTKAYENYRNSIRAGADNAINYYNFGIFLLKEKKIDEGIFYLYLARIIDSNKRTISPAFWSQVFRILNPNLILSNQVGLRTKIMFVDLKLLLNYPQNIETDITNLKPQLLSNALFSKYVLYFELKSSFLKNGNFSREQIDEIFNNIEPHPELISVTPKIFLNFSDAQIYANKLLEKATKYGDENVFNIGLLVTLLKTFENYSVQGISEKLSGIINLRSPKTFKNEKQLNSFGPAGFDFDPTNINAGDEKKLSLYFGIDNVLPLKIKGRFEISSDTFQLGFNSGKSEIDLDLEKFYSGDVIKKNVVLDFKDYIPSGFYNLKFVYRIDCEDTIYSENLNMIKNEFVYHIAKIEVTGDKNKELENRALYCIKNAMYDEADDILFNKLPDDYKDTDVFYQFNKYKIKVIKNNFETALKQKEKIEKLGEKFLAEIPKSVSKINSFYYYNEKTNFINNRFIKKSKNPKDYIFTYLFEMYDSDLFDIIYKEPESKPKIIHYEEKPPFPYFIHKKSSTLDEQLFFIKSCLECIKKDFYDPNNFYSPSIIEFSTAFIKSLSLSQHKNKIIDMCLDFNNFLCKIAESDNIKSGELFNGKNLKTVYNFIDILSDLDRNKEADLLLNKIRKHIKSYQQSNDIFYFYKNLNQILKNHSGDGQILTNFTFSKIKEFPYNYLTEIKNVFNNHIENDYIKKNVIKILDKKFLFDDSKFLIKDRTDYFDVLENEVILYYPDLIKLRFKIKLTNLFYPNSYYDISVGYLDPFYDFIGIDNIRISGDLLKNEVILYEKNLRIEKQFFENIKTGKMQIKLKYFNIKDKIYPFLIPEMKY